MRAMQQEHASKDKFSTPNYGIETCPAEEWRIVFECDSKVEKEYNRHKRRIQDWRQVVSREQLQFRDSALTDVEAIAIILYTGPMV